MVEEDQEREHLNRSDIQKSMGLGRMHLRVLMELATVTVGPLSAIFVKLACSGEVLLSLRKSKRIQASFTSNPEMKTEQINLENICKHMKKKKVAKRHQHGFTKGKFTPDQLEVFPHKMSG